MAPSVIFAATGGVMLREGELAGAVLFVFLMLLAATYRQRRRALAAEGRGTRVEASTANILNAASEAFVGMDNAGRITAWNRQAEAIFGWTPEEAMGRMLSDTILPGQGHDYRGALTRFLAGEESPLFSQRLEIRVVDRHGREFPVELAVWAVDHGDGAPSFHALLHDISVRREAEETIRVARDHALDSSRLKSQFLANMSHEIRTPMNGILGMANLVLSSELQPTQRHQLLVLRESGESLLAIINQILDFSKVEAGRLELEETDFDLAGMVQSLATLLSSPAEEKGVAFDVNISPKVSWVRGDPTRLRQIITNLGANAVKFTDAGVVTVSIMAVSGGLVRFEVADTGIGIEPAARESLLEPFSQADASTTRRFGGTGLGLAICRELVDLMGGTLDYRSRAGAGSTFWFETPLPAAIPPATPDPSDLATEGGGANQIGKRQLTTAGGPKSIPSAGRRVLLADDFEANQEVATAMLEQLGYRVDVATNGAGALDAVQTTLYDVILMDCLMPVMDGYEATDRIRKLEGSGRRTPIIAVTASALTGDRERCLAAGMDDYVSKPLDASALGQALARCCPGGPSDQVQERVFAERHSTLEDDIGTEAYLRLFNVFMSGLPECVAKLNDAIGVGDVPGIRQIAHNLKGTAACYGAMRLGELADQIERLPAGQRSELHALVDQLIEECARLQPLQGSTAVR